MNDLSKSVIGPNDYLPVALRRGEEADGVNATRTGRRSEDSAFGFQAFQAGKPGPSSKPM